MKDREAWCAAVQGVTKNWTQVNKQSIKGAYKNTHEFMIIYIIHTYVNIIYDYIQI